MIKRFSEFGISALAAAAFLVIGPTQADAQGRDRSMQLVSEYPLVGDEGQRVPNHRVKLLGPIDRLPGVVTVGNPNGKTTLIEFYDLNCPFCRIASTDVGDLIDVDSELKLVLVPYPVLGVASIAASRVELAIAKLGTPEQFYAFHRKIYSQRGTTDGLRALEVAHELGFDEHTITAVADSDEITQTMKKSRHSRQYTRARGHAFLYCWRRRNPRLPGALSAAGDRRRGKHLRQGYMLRRTSLDALRQMRIRL